MDILGVKVEKDFRNDGGKKEKGKEQAKEFRNDK